MNTDQCKKAKYHSEEFALLDIAKFNRFSKGKRVPQRTYLCTKCNTWHITSQGGRIQNNIISEQEKTIDNQQEQIRQLKEVFQKKSEEVSALKKEKYILLDQVNRHNNIVKGLENQVKIVKEVHENDIVFFHSKILTIESELKIIKLE